MSDTQTHKHTHTTTAYTALSIMSRGKNREQNPPKTLPSLARRGSPSNIPMPRSTPRTHHPKPQLRRFTHFRRGMPRIPHWLLWREPHSSPKLPSSRRPIPKPNYLPHPWTHPTYHPKSHLYLISRFATVHRKVRHTDQQLA